MPAVGGGECVGSPLGKEPAVHTEQEPGRSGRFRKGKHLFMAYLYEQ